MDNDNPIPEMWHDAAAAVKTAIKLAIDIDTGLDIRDVASMILFEWNMNVFQTLLTTQMDTLTEAVDDVAAAIRERSDD